MIFPYSILLATLNNECDIFLQGDLKQKQKEKDLADEENFGNSSWGQFRASLWNILEYPWTSRLAQVSLNIVTQNKLSSHVATTGFKLFLLFLYLATFVCDLIIIIE